MKLHDEPEAQGASGLFLGSDPLGHNTDLRMKDKKDKDSADTGDKGDDDSSDKGDSDSTDKGDGGDDSRDVDGKD